MAIDIIFELIEKGNYSLCWSFILEDENNNNPVDFLREEMKINVIE